MDTSQNLANLPEMSSKRCFDTSLSPRHVPNNLSVRQATELPWLGAMRKYSS